MYLPAWGFFPIGGFRRGAEFRFARRPRYVGFQGVPVGFLGFLPRFLIVDPAEGGALLLRRVRKGASELWLRGLSGENPWEPQPKGFPQTPSGTLSPKPPSCRYSVGATEVVAAPPRSSLLAGGLGTILSFLQVSRLGGKEMRGAKFTQPACCGGFRYPHSRKSVH